MNPIFIFIHHPFLNYIHLDQKINLRYQLGFIEFNDEFVGFHFIDQNYFYLYPNRY
jgi:hypothetical protein